MNILAFSPYYPPHLGGLEKYAEELHSNLAEWGHTITVITSRAPKSSKKYEASNYSNSGKIIIIRLPVWEVIFSYPIPAVWLPSFWSNINAALPDRYDLTISYTRFFLFSLLALAFAKLKNIPWCHIEHGSGYVVSGNAIITAISRLYDNTFGRLIFKTSDINIAPSQSAARFIKRFNQRKVPVIYRGLPYKSINSISANKSAASKHQNRVILTYAGRLIASKGLSDLFHAFVKVQRQPLLLYIAGDGPSYSSLLKLAQNLGISKRIRFTGLLTFSDTIALIKASDIIINPSYSEGLPTLILEAGACEKPSIATNVGGTPEVINHNITGLLYPPGDIATLSKHLRYLASNPSLRKKIGQSAYKSIISRFSWPIAVDQYLHVFNQIKS